LSCFGYGLELLKYIKSIVYVGRVYLTMFLCARGSMEREVRAISVNNGWEGIWKEAVMDRFEELLCDSP